MLEICKQSNEICNSSIENAVGRDKQNNNFWFTQKIKSYCKLEWSLNDCCHSFWHGNFLVKTLDSIHLVNNTVIHSLLIFGRQMHSNLIPFFFIMAIKGYSFWESLQNTFICSSPRAQCFIISSHFINLRKNQIISMDSWTLFNGSKNGEACIISDLNPIIMYNII